MTTAIILAGGLGTRLRAAVPDLPKPLAPVAGRPFLEHLMARCVAQGVTRFVLAVGYRHEAIVARIGSTFDGVPVAYSVETTPMGTGGGLLQAAAGLPADERFVLLNGDTWFDVPLDGLLADAAARDADVCMALFRAGEPGRYMGLGLAPDGRVTALDHDDSTIGRTANGGVWAVHPRVLGGTSAGPRAAVSLESRLLPAWLASGRRLFGVVCDGAFIDIGVPDDWRRAASVIAPGIAARETTDA
jgi:D-glycero-alpha-D-manno-heptose 1-phosphate guanylyltransferase